MPRVYVSRISECGHPERKHRANGLCGMCYSAMQRKQYPDRAKNHTRAHRAKHRKRHLEEARQVKASGYTILGAGKMSSRAHHLKQKFGLTIEQYNAMRVECGGLCCICRRPEISTRAGMVKHLAVDHDHKTGKVRGLLCQKCNTMVGHANDDPGILEAAVAYLAKANGTLF